MVGVFYFFKDPISGKLTGCGEVDFLTTGSAFLKNAAFKNIKCSAQRGL